MPLESIRSRCLFLRFILILRSRCLVHNIHYNRIQNFFLLKVLCIHIYSSTIIIETSFSSLIMSGSFTLISSTYNYSMELNLLWMWQFYDKFLYFYFHVLDSASLYLCFHTPSSFFSTLNSIAKFSFWINSSSVRTLCSYVPGHFPN